MLLLKYFCLVPVLDSNTSSITANILKTRHQHFFFLDKVVYNMHSMYSSIQCAFFVYGYIQE